MFIRINVGRAVHAIADTSACTARPTFHKMNVGCVECSATLSGKLYR